MTVRGRVRVAIVEDHLLFAESLQLALELNSHDVVRVPVLLDGGSTAGLHAAVVRTRPDVVIVDLNLGRTGDGATMIEPLARLGIAVLVVTANHDRARWGECLRNGARGVLLKTAPLNQILSAVRRTSVGIPVMTREDRDDLIREWHRHRAETRDARSRLQRLTARESEVLGGLMQGQAVRQIAARSVVSEATVRSQVKSILAKLGVSSQLAAVGIAHEVGWHPPGGAAVEQRDPQPATGADECS